MVGTVPSGVKAGFRAACRPFKLASVIAIRNALSVMVAIVVGLMIWRLGPRMLRMLSDGDGPTRSAASAAPPAPSEAHEEQVASGPPLRAFFVGNSHTFYNTMPQMIVELARASAERSRAATTGAQSGSADRPFEFGMDTPGGATLEDHVTGGRLPQHLAGARWDYVILQDQQQRPSFRFNMSQIEKQLFAPARTLDIMIKAAGAKTLLYMTAARREGDPENVTGDSYTNMQDRVSLSYQSLGTELHAQVIPVGLAFRWAHEKRPELPLWIADGSHPSRQGSYLTACSFYAGIYGKSPEGNTYHAELPEEEARFLQRAADVARHLQ